MTSFSELVKRVGVGGRLVPFFKCVCVYFLAGAAGCHTPSVGVVVAKCSPIVCLLVVLLLHDATLPHDQRRYVRRIALGLALSALGDAVLVWPQRLVCGLVLFAAAHVWYLAAFGWEPRAWRVGATLGAGSALFTALLPAPPPGPLRMLVPLYAALIATMAWRGVARGLHSDSRMRRAGAVGALLFVLSDAVLAYSLFAGPVPYKQVWVMSTYYLGQMGIALSALETPPVP